MRNNCLPWWYRKILIVILHYKNKIYAEEILFREIGIITIDIIWCKKAEKFLEHDIQEGFQLSRFCVNQCKGGCL